VSEGAGTSFSVRGQERIEMDPGDEGLFGSKALGSGQKKREKMSRMRQETKANVRQFKEENKTQLLEGIQEIKSELERRLREEKGDP